MSVNDISSFARSQQAAEPDIQDEPVAGQTSLMTRLGKLWERGRQPSEADLKTLFEARLTDVAANRQARDWCDAYRRADGTERRAMLAVLARLAAAFEPRSEPCTRLFKRFNAQSDGLRFLVDLRSDILRWRKQVAGLQVLDKDLEALLSAWFDVGLLELRPLTWDSPASLLEKLILYEAVHEIQSWDDLRHRVAPDRRCYAYFHPKMSDVPLIFVEVAFAAKMADNVQALLDTTAPPQQLDKARCAVFYSISNTQPGLRGISFGNFLLKRVIERLLEELPKLKSFATLSPIPGFTDWLAKLSGPQVDAMLKEKNAGPARPADGQRWVEHLAQAALAKSKAAVAAQRQGLKLAACYLQTIKNEQPLDTVARFHLGNGARIERLNWAADTSEKGLRQSCAMMVNYVYELDELDNNLSKLGDGKPRVGRGFGRV